jgi:hypothetical protein
MYKHTNSKACPDMLAYKLGHQYTDANLKFNALKGRDREVVEHLQGVCQQIGSHFYLAQLEKRVVGGCDDDDGDHYDDYHRYGGDSDDDSDSDESANEDGHHYLTEIYESSLQLPRVVDIRGETVATKVRIDEDEIIQDEIFDGRSPDEEDYEGYSGNAGASATHWYRDTV